MKLTELLTDDDAVSPVIGVILMVAITVILAAVIAGFVLNLGGSVDSGKQASFSIDYDDGGSGFTAGDNDDSITINHRGGDTIPRSELAIVVDGTRLTDADFDEWGTEVTAGDSETIDEKTTSVDLVSGDEVRLVWESDKKDQTATLETWTIP